MELFYNNAVSYSDPLDVVQMLRLIKKETGAKLTVSIHDYFPVCPSYTLINEEGRHCRLPDDLDICNRCLVNKQLELVERPEGGIGRWRETWGALIADAETVLCFSEDTTRIMQKAYPHAAAKTVIRPHNVDYLPVRRPSVNLDGGLHIGVVGGISYAKGADVVRRVAEFIAARNLKVRITVVGRMWYEEQLPLSVRITGPYERENLAEILERERINVCFLPSIWPETFSYVTEELMQLKMPLCCFDLGAPADRVRTYPLGRVLSSIDDPGSALEEIVAFYEYLRRIEKNKNWLISQ